MPSPARGDFDRFRVPRIQASDEEVGNWFGCVENNPDLTYVSDENPDRTSVAGSSDNPYWRVDS